MILMYCYLYLWITKKFNGLNLRNMLFLPQKVAIKSRLCQWITNISKRAGWNERAGGDFSTKSINVQSKKRRYRLEFFLKINKRACTSIRWTRVDKSLCSRCLMVSTNQADPSCFYYKISWILMERRWFYFFRPLHLLQGLRSNNIK